VIDRRKFLSDCAAITALISVPRAFAKGASLTHKERVDRALAGTDMDRPPFTFYHHNKRTTPEQMAKNHLEFHRAYNTDIVKVMNDFSYPRSTAGKWWELKPLDSPYPGQLRVLEEVRKGLNGDAYFIDTLYGPYMTARILLESEPEFEDMRKAGRETEDVVVQRLHAFQQEHPKEWEAAMEAITQSTINHIRLAKQTGASGALVSVFNAESKFGSVADYERFSRPYDKRIFDALADTKLTVLHLHTLERPFLAQFREFKAPVIQHSVKVSGIPIAEVRKTYSQTILGGVDEIDFKKLSTEEMRREWMAAREQAGSKYIAAPGCSVPDDSTAEELARFTRAVVES
jgi:uroporphyrinogen decarboxylase